MAISFVNGFLCTCSCDVAKAKQGQDPHPAEHAARLRAERGEKEGGAQAAPGAEQASVVFGGSLSNVQGASTPISATQSANPPTPQTQGSIVDILA